MTLRLPMAPMLFLDFDGTITCRDATDAILEAYADSAWLGIEEDWKAGRLSSRECLTAQMALVTATPEAVDSLLDAIEIDQGLVRLLGSCAAQGVDVHIVSDGFDYCIERILRRPSLHLAPHLVGVQIVSSHLEADGARWRTGFRSFGEPCAHGCATCKPTAMAFLNHDQRPTIFVGDGLSDKYAAAAADLVFAKDTLASYCDQRAIAYTGFSHLGTVAEHVGRLLEAGGC